MIVNTCSRMVKQHSRIEQFYPEITCGVYYSNTGMNIKSDQSILNGYVLEYCGYLNFSCHTEFIEVRIVSLLNPSLRLAQVRLLTQDDTLKYFTF